MSQPPRPESPHGLAQVDWRPPLLRGERVLLRGYELSDAPAIHAYASDVETTRYVSFETHSSIDGAYAFLNGVVANNYRRRQLDYAICLLDHPERAIGGTGALVTSDVHKVMEIGYVLDRAHWGRGLVPEAARLVLDHAFATTDVARIVAPIFPANARSRRVAEKLGMTLDGILRSALFLRGRRWDDAIYSILRPEWEAARTRCGAGRASTRPVARWMGERGTRCQTSQPTARRVSADSISPSSGFNRVTHPQNAIRP